MPSMNPLLSVIVPAFNEQGRIPSTLKALQTYLGSQSYDWEIIVVDDGGTDGTAEIVGELAVEGSGVRIEKIPHGGKGSAVRHGMLAAGGAYRFMCDADLAMPIEQLPEFLKRMDDGYDIVIGSREAEGARRFGEPPARHFVGRVFNSFVGLAAVRGFRDTQCGFKCFRGEVAEQLFPLQRTNGFAFDVEILYLALNRGLRVLELPVDWYYQQSSRVRVAVDSFRMFRDTLGVRYNDLRGRYDTGVKSDGAAD